MNTRTKPEPAKPSPTIHRSAFANSQARDYAHILRAGAKGNEVLRISAHHDMSYQNQSTARIEIWTPAGWTQVAHLHSREVTSSCAKGVISGSEPIPPESFAAVEKTLLTIARAILGETA